MIIVDSLRFHDVAVGRLNPQKWCHMTSTVSKEELHAFAASIGLKRSWFQEGNRWHYDLTESRRREAVKMGASEVTAREFYDAVVDRIKNGVVATETR